MITLPQSYSHTLVYVHNSFIPLLLSSCLHSHNHTLTHIITTSLIYHNPTQIYTFLIYIPSLIYIHIDTSYSYTHLPSLKYTTSHIRYRHFKSLNTPHIQIFIHTHTHIQTIIDMNKPPLKHNTQKRKFPYIHTLSQILSLQSPLLNNFQNIRSNCYPLK